jgi:hypothetical protein
LSGGEDGPSFADGGVVDGVSGGVGAAIRVVALSLDEAEPLTGHSRS